MITLRIEPISLSSFFSFDLIFCTSPALILASKFYRSIAFILASKLTRRSLWRVEIFAGYNFFGSQLEDTITESLSALYKYVIQTKQYWTFKTRNI